MFNLKPTFMKKSLKYLVMTLALVPFFTSCEEESTAIMGGATITLNSTTAKVENAKLSTPITGTIVAEKADAVIESISIDAITTGTEGNKVNLFKMIDLDRAENGSYSFTITTEEIKSIIAIISKIQITAKVSEGESSEKSVIFNVTQWTDLAAAKPFNWVRAGGRPADLSQFGLAWAQNTDAPFRAIVKKDGSTRLVELSTSDWASIETAEELKKAVDTKEGINEYREIAVGGNQPYDVVLAVDKGGIGDYYIINIKSSNTTGTPGNYTYTISGFYKTKVTLAD